MAKELTKKWFLTMLNRDFKDIRIKDNLLELKTFYWTIPYRFDFKIKDIIKYIMEIIKENNFSLSRFDENMTRKQIYFSFFIKKK